MVNALTNPAAENKIFVLRLRKFLVKILFKEIPYQILTKYQNISLLFFLVTAVLIVNGY